MIPRAGRNPERWQRLTSGLDQLPEPLAVIGNWRADTGVILHINPAWTELTGYTAAEVLGRPARAILFAIDTDAEIFDALRDAVQLGTTYDGAVICPRKNSQPLRVRLRAWSRPHRQGRRRLSACRDLKHRHGCHRHRRAKIIEQGTRENSLLWPPRRRAEHREPAPGRRPHHRSA